MERGVYALRLKDDKYYVGYSANMVLRIKQHFEGEGICMDEAPPARRGIGDE